DRIPPGSTGLCERYPARERSRGYVTRHLPALPCSSMKHKPDSSGVSDRCRCGVRQFRKIAKDAWYRCDVRQGARHILRTAIGDTPPLNDRNTSDNLPDRI